MKILQKLLGIDKIINELKKQNEHLERLSGCVYKSSEKYGRGQSMIVRHWNN